MTDKTLLVNLALQSFGSRTTVTAAELLGNTTNEAIQANLTFDNTRDSLLRMAPWDCGLKTANLTYLTSVPGTQQNASAAQPLWAPGLPRPPWAYEYQYPVDCLRACWIIPASQTCDTGVPITTAVTGNIPSTWLGAPIVFKVGTDQFLSLTSLSISALGSGYMAGEILILALQPNAAGNPQGAPAQIRVLTVNGSGGILTAEIVPIVIDSDPAIGGSYFYAYATQPVAVASTTGVGIGATFSFPTGITGSQRVIYTNQEYATLVYVQQVTDPNVWDPMFQDAFLNALGADLCMALSGDKGLANLCIQRANNSIALARATDGNEGLTINDVVPDWIRIRGIQFDTQYLGPWGGFDWGGFLSGYN